jgi:hypothetical protein
MASVLRQLNLYGFRCIRVDDKGKFWHPLFVRGKYDVVRIIRRKKTWTTKRRASGVLNSVENRTHERRISESVAEVIFNSSPQDHRDFAPQLSKDFFDEMENSYTDSTLDRSLEPTPGKYPWNTELFEQLEEVEPFDWFTEIE